MFVLFEKRSLKTLIIKAKQKENIINDIKYLMMC